MYGVTFPQQAKTSSECKNAINLKSQVDWIIVMKDMSRTGGWLSFLLLHKQVWHLKTASTGRL